MIFNPCRINSETLLRKREPLGHDENHFKSQESQQESCELHIFEMNNKLQGWEDSPITTL